MKRIYQDAYRIVRRYQRMYFVWDNADNRAAESDYRHVLQALNEAIRRYEAMDTLYPEILEAAIISYLDAGHEDYAGMTPDTFTMGF